MRKDIASWRQTAQKWYDIEAQNVKDLAKIQLTGVMPDAHGSVKTVGATKNFSIGYLPTVHALVLKNSRQGKLIVVDLRGRVISRFKLSDLQTNGNVIFSLPASLSTGLYLARFEGVNGIIQQAKISITK